MNSASTGTYLSKKQINAISEKREKLKKKAAKKAVLKSSNQDGMIQPKTGLIGEKLDSIKEEEQNRVVQMSAHIGRASSSDSGSDDERNRSIERVDSDELDGGMNLSEEEDADSFRVRNKASKAMRKRPARQYQQEVDTNMFQIEFKTLADNAEIATGDPFFCAKCKAVLNLHSVIEEVKSENGEQKTWTCEFCLTKNDVSMLDDEEKPQTKAVNYIVEAAAQVQDKMALGNKDISVVFCSDMSGSMCVSQPVQGKFKIKGDKKNDMADLMKFCDDNSDQYQQGERNVTYVSRMQCLQAAIDSQISDMANGAADRKLGLVTFNNEVTVFGDGTQDPQIITGDKLEDYDYLMKNGSECGQNRMKNKVGETAKILTDKLMGLEETGPTALGPAVATAVAMAAEGAPGSQVVICTDGLANIGLGAFDEAKDPEQMKKVEEFYEKIGQYAKEKGLTINIVSIIGDECNLDSLSMLAELTGGNVERVDPVSLTKNFANILSQPIIASNVVAKVKLHKGLQFRNENPEFLSEDKTMLVRDIGNVTMDTEITFEYTLKPINELAEMEDLDLAKLDRFPFQTQITYKALDGNKCIRVITSEQKVINDREVVEKNADYNLISQNVMQKGAMFARQGNYREAQSYAKVWNRKIRNNEGVNSKAVGARKGFASAFGGLYGACQQQDQMEGDAEEAQENQLMSLSKNYAEDEQLNQKKQGGGFMSGIKSIFGGGKPKTEAQPQMQMQQPSFQKSKKGSMNVNSSKRSTNFKMSDSMSCMVNQVSRINQNQQSALIVEQPMAENEESLNQFKIPESKPPSNNPFGMGQNQPGVFGGLGNQFGGGMGNSFGVEENAEMSDDESPQQIMPKKK